MEYGLGAAGADLGQPLPARIAHARRTVAGEAIAHEIDIDVLIRRPVALEVVEERGPVRHEPVHLEIAQRKRKSVVDADQGGYVLGQSLHQPLRDPAPRPVFFQRRWWRNLDGRIALGEIDPQA